MTRPPRPTSPRSGRRTGSPCSRDAAHPPVRGALRRALQRRRDPQVHAPVHRRGGRRRGRLAGAATRATPSCRPTASTATRWPGACRWRRCWPRCSAARRRQPRPRRLDAPVRRLPSLLRRQRDRRRGLPLAVGLALADHCRRRAVTACLFGDGAAAEGEFHESLNLAALWRLPVVFCCENNQYAMGTALARSERRPTWHCGRVLRDAVLGGGWHGRGRGRDAPRAVATIRAGGGPCSWNCGPTGSGRTRCTTPTATASCGDRPLARARPDRTARSARWARGPSTKTSSRAWKPRSPVRSSGGHGRRGRDARTGRGPHPLRRHGRGAGGMKTDLPRNVPGRAAGGARR